MVVFITISPKEVQKRINMPIGTLTNLKLQFKHKITLVAILGDIQFSLGYFQVNKPSHPGPDKFNY